MKQNNPDIDNYIAGFATEIQELLEQVRQTVREAAPEAEEAIKYGMPTFILHGNLVHFAAFKNHIGFYPAPQGLAEFKEELSGYKGAKGSVQFPLNEPLPLDLIARITAFRVNENLAKKEDNSKKTASAKKRTKLPDQEQVTEFIQKLDPEMRKAVALIRQIIMKTDTEIGEQIKWNNPGFYYTGKIKPFNPKEYKRDIAVLNLHKGQMMLVFPSGAKVNDTSGFLEGDYKDGRRIVIFRDLEDVKSKEMLLQHVVSEWLKLVEKE